MAAVRRSIGGMRETRGRRRSSRDGEPHGSPAETLHRLASLPSSLEPHDPFRLGIERDGRVIGGYRVLRLLGRGSRADVYLGHLPTFEPTQKVPPADVPPSRPAGTSNGTGFARNTGTEPADATAPFDLPAEVALKVFHADTPVESVDREFTALSALRSPHVVPLLDIARTADGPPCFLLGRCGGGSLAALLEARHDLRAGEAVTVLVPVLDALVTGHGAGYTHGSLRLSSVLFDATGAPVVTGWGHGAALRDAGGRAPGPERRAAAPAVRADLSRFAAVTAAVLGRVAGGDRGLADTVGRLVAHPDAVTGDRIVDAFFAFADPLPVTLLPADGAARPPSLARPRPPSPLDGEGPALGRTGGPVGATRGSAPGGGGPTRAARHHGARDARAHADAVVGSRFRDRMRDRMRAVSRGKARFGARVREEVQRVRRPIWTAAAVAAFALVAGILLSTVAFRPSTADAPGTIPPAPIRSDAAVGPDAPGSAGSATPPSREPAPGEAPPEDASDPGEGTPVGLDAAVVDALRTTAAGNDPVAAASALLALRTECLRTASEPCLLDVDQPGSVALAADLAELRARAATPPGLGTGAGGETLPATEPGPPVLIERLGGTAIVAVSPLLLGATTPDTPPASLLMIRSEAGWRIRDVL